MDRSKWVLLGLVLLWSMTGHVSANLLVTWPAKTEPFLAGYNVYRATPNIDSVYSKLNPEGVLITQTMIREGQTFGYWLDTTVFGLTRYYYIVEAVDTDGEVYDTSSPKCIVHVCHGDTNVSGSLEEADIVALRKHLVEIELLTGLGLQAADVNLDKKVDEGDLVLLRQYVAEFYEPEAHCFPPVGPGVEKK